MEYDIRESAQRCAGYYETQSKEYGADGLKKGAETANEWLRLIDAETVTQEEVAILLSIARANMNEGSYWFWLAGSIYTWASSKGFVVPSQEVWFSWSPIFRSDYEKLTALERANWLIGQFENNTRDDPEDAAWRNGASIATEWRNMIDASEVTYLELSQLLEKLQTHIQSFRNVNYYLGKSIYHWCSDIGYSELVPENWWGRASLKWTGSR
jgi:hypothetical protein